MSSIWCQPKRRAAITNEDRWQGSEATSFEHCNAYVRVYVCTHNTAPSNLTCPKLFILTLPFCGCGSNVCSLLVLQGHETISHWMKTFNRSSIQHVPHLSPECSHPKVSVCKWLLHPLIREPTADGINTVISHRVLNTPCYLPCLTQVLSLPASTPLCFSLVQAAQMPWHFGNVKQILARWHSETSAVFSLKGDGGRGAINMDASSSNVAFFLRVFACVCVGGKKVAGTLCAVFNLFACTSTNMGQ